MLASVQGISRFTVYAIQGDDSLIPCGSAQANEDGKYSGFITRESGEILIHTPPVFISDSEATEHMKDLMKQINNLEL